MTVQEYNGPPQVTIDYPGNKVESDDMLVELLYVLMRDHLPVGTIATLIKEMMKSDPSGCIFTNTQLATMAKAYADNLRGRRLGSDDS